MYSVFRKEINLYFSSVIAYLSMAIFFVVVALNLWFFPGNIFESGYASLQPYFLFAPWILIFLMPALTMRLISEEYNQGTIEILATQSIGDLKIILGKYLAASALWLLTLLPTLIYFLCITSLDSVAAPADSGAIAGSYIGLFLLGLAFISISLFASSVSKNQVTAFLIGVVLCYLFYNAFFQLSQLEAFAGQSDYYIQSLGMGAHYEALSRGVVDTRDLLYFFSLIAAFILFTKVAFESRKW
ncbi:MAG: ABC transporter permease subunit [Bacteroidetes bacterium]|nr:ABC transporter permease subunit [Bacteroidota bacterium]